MSWRRKRALWRLEPALKADHPSRAWVIHLVAARACSQGPRPEHPPAGARGSRLPRSKSSPEPRFRGNVFRRRRLYQYRKAVAKISTKNQITIPVAALEETGLHAGEAVTIEPVGDGELRVRRAALTFDDAFGVLTGLYPAGYLAHLDTEDAQR
jgi:AbrB family looped-hinge helix DNA binding protein